jgi:hypothetical protein
MDEPENPKVLPTTEAKVHWSVKWRAALEADAERFERGLCRRILGVWKQETEDGRTIRGIDIE